MKYNLLKTTQYILSAMDSDEITDIDDTLESQQVVDIIESVYNEMAAEITFPEHDDLFQMDETSSTTPTVLTRPSNCVDMHWLQYNHQETGENNTNWVDLTEITIQEFLRRENGLDVDQTNVETFTYTTKNSETYTVKVYNDRMPQVYMVLNDNSVICDAYDSSEETELQTENTRAFGKIVPTFTRSNSFEFDIDEYNFMQFFNECKSQCFADLKQMVNPKAEKKSREGRIRTQKRKHDLRYQSVENTVQRFPNFGRK
jgi:hypothetical protein